MTDEIRAWCHSNNGCFRCRQAQARHQRDQCPHFENAGAYNVEHEHEQQPYSPPAPEPDCQGNGQASE